MPTRSQKIRQAVRGGPIDKLKAEVVDLKDQVKDFKVAVREVMEATHVIHKDGTYSNSPTGQVLKHLDAMAIFKTAKGSQFQVMKPTEDGAYVTGHPYSRQPRVDECDFWTWEKIQAAIKGT